jgi:TetR/AcrR family transcriptional regulator
MSHRDPPATDRLIQAALTEFARHQPAGARTSRIATQAAVNKQLIHYYFGNKDGLYQAVLVRVAQEAAGALTSLPLIGLTAVERLRRLVRGQFDFFAQHTDHTRVLLDAETGGDWADAAVKPVVELLTEGQATGFFRDDIVPLTHARQALVLQLGYFALLPVTSEWANPVEWRDRSADLIVRGCTW